MRAKLADPESYGAATHKPQLCQKSIRMVNQIKGVIDQERFGTHGKTIKMSVKKAKMSVETNQLAHEADSSSSEYDDDGNRRKKKQVDEHDVLKRNVFKNFMDSTQSY